MRAHLSRGLAALLLALAAARAAATDPAPRLGAMPSRIEASADLRWPVRLRVDNPLAGPLRLDSLLCRVEDLDPGETRGSRSTPISLPGALRVADSMAVDRERRLEGPSALWVPARSGVTLAPELHALAEHARLAFRLHARRADGAPLVLTANVEALPGVTSRRFPSRFLDVDGRRVEYVLIPARADSAPAPGVLLVHGHGGHARHMLGLGLLLSGRGFTAMMVSMPGYGLSQGPADFMGPATIRSLAAALDQLGRGPGVDRARLAAWGISRGATAVTLLAQTRTDLAAVVSQAGIYDLWAVYRGTRLSGMRGTILAEVGEDSSDWRARSPALRAEATSAAVLILHGERDPRVPAAQAHGFRQALMAAGKRVEARFFPGAGHFLPRARAQRLALEFLQRQLADAHPARGGGAAGRPAR